MKITPLDIQQQQFRVRFRGFDIVEVDNFLDLVANEFEELLKENSLLREEGRRKSAKISELEAMEKDLREALVSVQRITEEMKNNARKEAELIVEEAKAQAQKIIDNAQAQALKVEEEINELKRQRTRVESSLRSTLDLHLKLLDTGKMEPGDHSG